MAVNRYILTAIALAAVLSLGGCKKAPVPESEDPWLELLGDRPIRFSTAVTETKAHSPMVDGTTFGVLAFLQEGDVEHGTVAHWSDGAGNGALWTPAFMMNQLVSKQAGAYTYTPVRYWPYNEENTISFWAYSPHNPSTVFYEAGTSNAYTTSSHGLPDIKFSVTNGQADFMTSALVQDKTYENCDPDGIVDLEFDHHLAWVEFKAKTAGDYSSVGQTITVTRIEIINAYNDGVFHPGTGTWTDKQVVTGVGRQAVAFSGSQEIVYSEARPCSSAPMLMIPQAMVHDVSAYGTVKARVSYTQTEGGQSVSKTVDASLEVETIDEWEAKNKYIYTFTITASDAVNLAVEVQKWEYWLGTSEYKENVTITKQLTWDTDTFVASTDPSIVNCSGIQSYSIAGETAQDYKIVVMKPGVSLKGRFIFDTPYQGTWYAMLEPVLGSLDGSILFSNNDIMTSGIVGSEVEITIKPANATVSSTQYAILRFMCRTKPAPGEDESSAQTLPVQDLLIGGPFIIQQNIN